MAPSPLTPVRSPTAAQLNVVLEPSDTPKLRTIGQVSVNGGYTLDRSVIPEMDVSRAQMDALGYTQVLKRCKKCRRSSFNIPIPARRPRRRSSPCAGPIRLKRWSRSTVSSSTTATPAISISRSSAVPAFNSMSVTEGLGPTDAEGSNTFGGAVNSRLPATDARGPLCVFGFGRLVRHDADLGQRDRHHRQTRITRWPATTYQSSGSGRRNRHGRAGEQSAQIYCGPPTKKKTPNCPFVRASRIDASRRRLGLVNLDYNFSQRSDVGFPALHAGR